MIRILGVDPGLADLGYGIISLEGNSLRHLKHGVIKTYPETPMAERLNALFEQLSEVIAEWKPQVASIEALFFAKNVQTAMPVAQARGVLLLACARSGLSVAEYTPLQIKLSVVGNGRAEKKQVQELVRLLLGLNTIPKPDHAADALAAAICHSHSSLRESLLHTRSLG